VWWTVWVVASFAARKARSDEVSRAAGNGSVTDVDSDLAEINALASMMGIPDCDVLICPLAAVDTLTGRSYGRIDPGVGGVAADLEAPLQTPPVPTQITAHVGWLNARFSLSLRTVEEMMLERGVAVLHETIRRWTAEFGALIAQVLRRRQSRCGDARHLDEFAPKFWPFLRPSWVQGQ